MFEVGHKFGNHNNHWRGGRLTKMQILILGELADKGLNALREIIEKTGVENSIRWQQLKIEAVRLVLSKLAPDLTAEVGNEWIEKYDERVKNFAARLIAHGNLQVIEPGKQADGTTGSV